MWSRGQSSTHPSTRCSPFRTAFTCPTARGNARSRNCWWAMRCPAVLLSPTASIAAARQLAPEGDCLIGENGTLLGIVLGSDLDEALRKGSGGAAVASVVRREVLD